MPATTIVDFTHTVAAIQERTDAAGVDQLDVGGEALRLYAALLTAGVLTPNAFEVTPQSGMTVKVGSGTAKADIAVVAGTIAGQGNYLARLDVGSQNVTIAGSDLTNPRIDEIYLIVADQNYGGTLGLPQIGYRRGDAGVSPTPPGPDAAWDAYLLLATITVAAGVGSISAGAITDERSLATLGIGDFYTTDEIDTLLADQVHDATHITTGTMAFARLPVGSGSAQVAQGNHLHDDRYYTEAETNSLLAGKANTSHGDHGLGTHKVSGDHDGRYYTEAEVNSLLGGKSDVGHGPHNANSYADGALVAQGNYTRINDPGGGEVLSMDREDRAYFAMGINVPNLAPTTLWPHNNANGSIRWMGEFNFLAQAHTASSKAHKKNITEIELDKALFSKLEPAWFRYKETSPYKKKFDPEVWAEFENPEPGRMGFLSEQVKEVAPHWVGEVNGIESVRYEGMLPDFMAWTVAAVRTLRGQLAAREG